MSTINTPNYIVGLNAGADLSADAKRYVALQIEADGDVNVAAANEQNFIGFLQDTPDDTKPASIAGMGRGSLAIAGGTITAGQFCTTDSSGHLVAISAETKNAVAIAMVSAVDNDVFEVLVLAPGQSVIVA